MSTLQPIPDDKDWTWVLSRPCPECGFAADTLEATEFGEMVRINAERWVQVLERRDAVERPAERTWSPLEYACHVRDVHRIFAERLVLMLETDNPRFPNWDQDATAVEERYAEQDPAVVAAELVEAAAHVASIYDGVHGDQWSRPGTRSNGSVFTVDTIGRYHLHDDVHHLDDVHG
ncbi:DinB family protein [Nocardioides jiangxiensis]|uniref:DinB family protein n=1 Tax=Nocardioides jiangxiensis TaxID=3064524 RepID=A0ABT9AYI0_9ACTN|nr:DinB family protein [Nocardioides sp. WY-20]MDO7866983.1 DinB family protein [Nocardioides sp. WY-20]